MHAEIEYPEIKAKFTARKKLQERNQLTLSSSMSISSNADCTHSPNNADNTRISNTQTTNGSMHIDEDLNPESVTILFPPHPENAFSKTGAKEYTNKSWEFPNTSISQDEPTSTYEGPDIAELDWSAQTQVWTVCSQRRPSQARYYLIDNRKDDLFNFLVQLDDDEYDETCKSEHDKENTDADTSLFDSIEEALPTPTAVASQTYQLSSSYTLSHDDDDKRCEVSLDTAPNMSASRTYIV